VIFSTLLQFSPTSEHILMAYGRRHNSLLRTIFLDGRNRVPMYTVLEVDIVEFNINHICWLHYYCIYLPGQAALVVLASYAW
jgi:hypothetical protein